MNRQELDREDLLRDAVAYHRRAEWLIRGEAVFVGLRDSGGASFYFGQDPVLQFNSERQLRRAFWNGRLAKAEAGRLVMLHRERIPGATHLVRSEPEESELQRLMSDAQRRLAHLREVVRSGSGRLVGQVPANEPVGELVLAWLDALLAKPLQIAARPHSQ